MLKHLNFIVFGAFLVAFMINAPVFANQTGFNKQKLGPNVKFSYSFRDYQGKSQSLSFYLPQRAIQKANQEFRPYSNYEANTYIYNRIIDYSRNLNNGVNVNVERSGNALNISANGASGPEVEKTLETIRQLNVQAQDEYLQKRFFIQDQSGKYVFPDHVRIAERYVSSMRPVSQSIKGQTSTKNMRESINFALNFLQSIPYDTLLSRTTAGGAGFTTPPGLFDINKGDCDTKTVALASILKNLYPRLRPMIIYTPGHAFIGMNIPAQPGDRTLNINGSTFVLGEPAGPGVLPMGNISPEAEAELRQSRYSYREVS